MKKTVLYVLLLTLFLIVCALPAQAEVEGRLVKSISFPEPVRQLEISPDGKMLLALGKEKVYLSSIQGQHMGEWPVGANVSRVVMQSGNLVLLQYSDSSKVDYLVLDVIQSIDISGAPIAGNVDAPVAIVVFDDFECPYCARLAPVLKRVLEKNPQSVKLAFKNFPLNMHKFAQQAALAAAAAGRQGKFWEMHDQLFANYNRLNDQAVVGFAKQLDLDMEQFAKDRKDPALQAALQRDMQQGQQLGVRGTPSVFVNGRLLQDRSDAGFQRAIDSELARLRQG